MAISCVVPDLSPLVIVPFQDPIPVRLSGRRHGAAQDNRVALHGLDVT